MHADNLAMKGARVSANIHLFENIWKFLNWQKTIFVLKQIPVKERAKWNVLWSSTRLIPAWKPLYQ